MKKRLLAVVLCVALAGMVTGCNGGAEGKTEEKEKVEQDGTKEPEGGAELSAAFVTVQPLGDPTIDLC